LPALALALVLVSWVVLVFELRLFEPIDARYTEAQDQAVGQPVRRPKKMDVFKWVVRFYPLLLLLLVLGVAIIAWSSQ
jgi:hypothetical protein